ncbi:MAG: transposase [Planctomycetaceae bacterium]|nr:transposase [Planctomycetaceae bacterium]
MPRIARIVLEGLPYHITQRGNNKQDVFFVDDDKKVYLEILKQQAEKYALTLMGYCLMTNHVHLIAIPAKAESLAMAVGRTHFIYTQYINRFHKRSGHLWQSRFYSCGLDEHHFFSAMRYIEHNPLRAGISRKPWNYEWSSAAAHIDANSKSELLDLRRWYEMMQAGQWKQLLMRRLPDKEIKVLRSGTLRGRPLGSDSFISKLEKLAGRRLRPLPVGRPKKENDGNKKKK